MISINKPIIKIDSTSESNRLRIGRCTKELNDGDTITDIEITSSQIALEGGDVIMVNGQSLTLTGTEAIGSTRLVVDSVTLSQSITHGAWVEMDQADLFVQYQRKTAGSVAGFRVDADGLTKGGIEITGWLDSDTMSGATANNVPTAESVKAYVDRNPINYSFITCTGTALTSATNGDGNAVVVPFDTESDVSSTNTITLLGSGGGGYTNGEYAFYLDAAANSGTYNLSWNISTNTNAVNNRVLGGVKLQSGTESGGTVTWSDVNFSHSWIYNRGTGGLRYASIGMETTISQAGSGTQTYYRIVLWKEDASNAGVKLITTTNGTQLFIKQLD